MKSFFRKLWQKLTCDHDWRHVNTIPDQNLRGGYDHLSEVYICVKCGKRCVVELPSM